LLIVLKEDRLARAPSSRRYRATERTTSSGVGVAVAVGIVSTWIEIEVRWV
jgi:hypothetical protein